MEKFWFLSARGDDNIMCDNYRLYENLPKRVKFGKRNKMPQIQKIKETMVKQEISDSTLSRFNFGGDSSNPHDVISVISKMDELLTEKQCLAVMEKQGCCKTGQRDKACREFARKYADKTLAEKVALLRTIRYMMSPSLNDDGTITVVFGGYQNGVHRGLTTCSCGTIKKLKQPFSVSRTYCGCCAGHFLYHYQNALGVKLRLKEIVSSPLDTDGEQPCGFVFEIIQ